MSRTLFVDNRVEFEAISSSSIGASTASIKLPARARTVEQGVKGINRHWVSQAETRQNTTIEAIECQQFSSTTVVERDLSSHAE